MKTQNTLPSPRSISEVFENGTSFIYCIGDGDCIGGEIADHDEPLYIDWDEDAPNRYLIYVQDSEDVLHTKMKNGQSLLANGDLNGYINATASDIQHDVYSVEEAIEVLKQIADQLKK